MGQLRMTKHEVREEAKEQEGNPQMKARVRRIQRDMARRRMMQAVPTATAVIVNPTHFAVAIHYTMESGSAPRVVAKGKNYLAARIRQKAIENQVPVAEIRRWRRRYMRRWTWAKRYLVIFTGRWPRSWPTFTSS